MAPDTAARCPVCNEPNVSQLSDCPYFEDSDHNDAALDLNEPMDMSGSTRGVDR